MLRTSGFVSRLEHDCITRRIAVGHDPASGWPGQAGASVLSAHDVTWFSRMGRLKRGNLIRYVTPRRTYTYKVTSHVIATAGSQVDSTKVDLLHLPHA